MNSQTSSARFVILASSHCLHTWWYFPPHRRCRFALAPMHCPAQTWHCAHRHRQGRSERGHGKAVDNPLSELDLVKALQRMFPEVEASCGLYVVLPQQAELDRIITSLGSMVWLPRDNYHGFIAPQEPGNCMTPSLGVVAAGRATARHKQRDGANGARFHCLPCPWQAIHVGAAPTDASKFN